MALSDDQRAMLRLLAQREQGYEDIAALMGLSVDDVRAKVKEALAQLEDEGVAAPSLPPEPPVAPAPPPAAKEPPAPVPEARPEPVVAATPPPTQPPEPGKPRDRGTLIAIGGGIAGLIVIVVLAVLLISNSGSDSDGGDSTATANSPASEEPNGSAAETVSGSKEPTVATLEAVDGSDAGGEALFGRVKDSLALGIKAEGLEPNPKGSVYMIWLAQTPQRMLPLTALAVPKTGRVNAQYAVPTEAVVYLASGEFDKLVLTRANNARLRASLERANKEKEVPAYTGTPVLEGTVEGPIVGAQARLEARQKEKEAE